MAKVNVDVDATLLSRGMMFRRRKLTLQAQTPPSSAGFAGEDVTERGESDDFLEFSEYIGRDLRFEQAPPQLKAFAAPVAGRQHLKRQASLLFERDEELMSAVDRLGVLGDSIDSRICLKMQQAVKALGGGGYVDAKDLGYEEYKEAAAPFVNNGNEEWMSVAKLFRFGEEVLTVSQESLDGEVDPILEQKLEDYNSRALVDLASAFLSRAGGLVGLLR